MARIAPAPTPTSATEATDELISEQEALDYLQYHAERDAGEECVSLEDLIRHIQPIDVENARMAEARHLALMNLVEQLTAQLTEIERMGGNTADATFAAATATAAADAEQVAAAGLGVEEYHQLVEDTDADGRIPVAELQRAAVTMRQRGIDQHQAYEDRAAQLQKMLESGAEVLRSLLEPRGTSDAALPREPSQHQAQEYPQPLPPMLPAFGISSDQLLPNQAAPPTPLPPASWAHPNRLRPPPPAPPPHLLPSVDSQPPVSPPHSAAPKRHGSHVEVVSADGTALTPVQLHLIEQLFSSCVRVRVAIASGPRSRPGPRPAH
jgi:hypothetical protein